MRTVYIAPYAPLPADFGGRLRIAALWRALDELTDARLIVLGDRPDRQARRRLAARGAIVLPPRRESAPARLARIARGALSGACIPAERYLSARRLARLGRVLDACDPDVIVLGDTFLGSLAPLLAGRRARVIVDTHNVESQLAWRIARRTRCPLSAAGFALLAVNTARTERRCLPSADVVWAVSDADAAWYRRHLPLRRVEVVPNVLDLSRYSRATGPTDAGPPVVLYVGWYAHRPNREAADRLIAASRLLIARGVAHRLRLVGRDPTRAMRRAAGRDEHIEVTGAVAEIPPELTGATVFAAPLTSGGGTKFKILEAFAASLPVLTTPVGAEGLHLRRGEQAEIVAPAAGPFADALAALLADPPRRTGLARAGRSHVERHFSQQSLTATIAALLGT